LKVTLDSDNYIYVDLATGVVCEGCMNMGDEVFDFKLVSWEEQDLSALYSQKEIIHGFPAIIYLFLLVTGILVTVQSKNMKKKTELHSIKTYDSMGGKIKEIFGKYQNE
jgi:hypothetical protein